MSSVAEFRSFLLTTSYLYNILAGAVSRRFVVSGCHIIEEHDLGNGTSRPSRYDFDTAMTPLCDPVSGRRVRTAKAQCHSPAVCEVFEHAATKCRVVV